MMLFSTKTVLNIILALRRYGFVLLASAIIIMIVSAERLIAQSKISKTTNSGTQTASVKATPKLTIEELTQQSDIITVGKVRSLQSEWTNNKERIQTRVMVSVDQTLKGTTPGSSMTVVIPGGEVDGVGEWYSHSLRFTNDENVVLFAKKGSDNEYRVTGGEFGKLSVKVDEKTGAKSISNLGSLKDFSLKIRNTVKLQDAGTTNNNK
jgi:hypothetical protein